MKGYLIQSLQIFSYRVLVRLARKKVEKSWDVIIYIMTSLIIFNALYILPFCNKGKITAENLRQTWQFYSLLSYFLPRANHASWFIKPKITILCLLSMHVLDKKVANIHPKWQLNCQKILCSTELHTYIASRTLRFVLVLHSANESSFIRHPVVVTVCFVTITHQRKQAVKDNDAK